jgi:hypothetical protein
MFLHGTLFSLPRPFRAAHIVFYHTDPAGRFAGRKIDGANPVLKGHEIGRRIDEGQKAGRFGCIENGAWRVEPSVKSEKFWIRTNRVVDLACEE